VLLAQIRLIWSPNFCLFERKTNLLRLEDKKFDIYERAVTYEGKEFFSKYCISNKEINKFITCSAFKRSCSSPKAEACRR
jgi:hypothetical protein